MRENIWKQCKHRGWWIEIKGLVFKRKYLFCERCKKAIPSKDVFRSADLLCSRSDGYFMTSKD